MGFSQIKGNGKIVQALKGMVDSGKVPHAIMFHEDDGGGAVALSLAFLQYLYCRNRTQGDSCGVCPSCNKIAKLIHPDLHCIFPVNTGKSDDYIDRWRALVLSNPNFTENELSEALEIEGKNAMIKVDEAKSLLEKLSFSALEKGYRSVLVYLPEKMNKDAANRLLKLIEEPPKLTQFILITHAPAQVLVTISSRCQQIRLDKVSGRDVVEGSAEQVQLLRSLMQGLLARDLYACLEIGDQLAALPSKEKAKSFCKFAADRLRDIFLYQQGMSSLVSAGPYPEAELSDWAARSRKTFPRKALDCFSKAQMLIGRNVNTKILFTDLVNSLYRSI